MGSVGQVVGGVVGGVVGYYFGGTQGGYLGFSLGMAAGSFIDPPRGARQNVEYKRTDLFYDTVARNMPVPIVYGVNRVGGNLLWLRVGGTFIEEGKGDATGGSAAGGGGKGSAKTDDSGQTPSVNVAWAIGLSEGPITAVAEVFVGDKRLSMMDGINYTAYLGTAQQMANTNITTDLSSLAPAFRNTAYLAIGATLQSPNVPVINAEISGILGTPAGDRYSGWSLGDQYTARALTMSDGSFIAMSNNGVMQRSTNYGESWTRIGCGIGEGSGFVTTPALADHPGVAGRVYAAVYTYPAGRIYVHRSDDYGQTWPSTSSVVEGSYDPSAMLGIRGNSSEVLLFTRNWFDCYSGIFRSTDGGDNFETVLVMPSGGWYYGIKSAIQVPETDTIYGLTGRWGTGTAPMFKSSDRGATWEQDQVAPITAVPDAGWTFNRNIFGFIGNAGVGGECYATYDGGVNWILTPMTNQDGGWAAIGAGRINSFGILVATTQYTYYEGTNIFGTFYSSGGSPRQFYSTTLGLSWQELGFDMSYPHVGGDSLFGVWTTQALWLTTEQICFGTGVPNYVVCLRYTTPTSCGNPALIIRDLLTNARYGIGLNQSLRIDENSFRSASAYCTAQVPSRLSSGHMEQRFCLDYVVDAYQPVVDHLRDMLATFGGYLCWSQGKVKLKIDCPASSTVQSFGMGQIVKDSFQWKKQTLRERPNVIHVDYVEPGTTVIDATGKTANADVGRYIEDLVMDELGNITNLSIYTKANYKTYRHDFVEASDPWDIERTNERREKVVNLTGIKRRSQAQRMAEYYLAKSIYCQNFCVFRIGIGGLTAEIGDVIAVSHDIPRWAGKKFRILEIQETEKDELQIGAIEYNDAIYRATAGSVPGQDPIWGNIPEDWTDAPYNVGRVTAYERPHENAIEINYTRVVTSDLFGSALIYRRIGEDGTWQLIGTQLSVAPTAYITSHVETITLVES